jgi:hypothetical protein
MVVTLHDVGLTIYGVTALTFMMAMYAFERRHRRFVLAFAVGCMLASSYGFLSGAWPFGAVEAIWSLVALRRYLVATREARRAAGPDEKVPR